MFPYHLKMLASYEKNKDKGKKREKPTAAESCNTEREKTKQKIFFFSQKKQNKKYFSSLRKKRRKIKSSLFYCISRCVFMR